MSQSITHRHRGRRIGEEWLVKYDDTESYIPDVTEVREEREYKYKHKHDKQALIYLVNWIISMLLNSLIPLFAFQISLLQWKVYIKSLPLFISFLSFPPPLQEVVNEVQLTVLSQHQYCVVLNPLGDDGRPRLGCRELRQGPRTFFLHPGNQFRHTYSLHFVGYMI